MGGGRMSIDRERLEELRGAPSNNVVDADHTPWLLTFADLLSLLLTFFVLLYSMKEISSEQWAATRQTLVEAFNPGRVEVTEVVPDAPVVEGTFIPQQGLGLGYLQTILDAQSSGFAVLEVAQIREEDRQLVISLPGSLMFGSENNADLAAMSAESEAALLRLGRALSGIRNEIFVGVHTPLIVEPDNRLYRDATALSLIRAQRVADRLRRGGYRQPIKAVGYGSSRFDTLDERLDVAIRDNLANRIDIVILPNSGNRDPNDFF